MKPFALANGFLFFVKGLKTLKNSKMTPTKMLICFVDKMKNLSLQSF